MTLTEDQKRVIKGIESVLVRGFVNTIPVPRNDLIILLDMAKKYKRMTKGDVNDQCN